MSKLFRKRLIPNECIALNDDIIIYNDNHKIITKWQTLHPKKTFSHGISLYCIDNGWKISKFYNENNELCYIYCDIIETKYEKSDDSYVFIDLLADVIIYPDNSIQVVDIDEFADAINDNIISKELLTNGLYRLNNLLQCIYSNEFNEYIKFIELHE